MSYYLRSGQDSLVSSTRMLSTATEQGSGELVLDLGQSVQCGQRAGKPEARRQLPGDHQLLGRRNLIGQELDALSNCALFENPEWKIGPAVHSAPHPLEEGNSSETTQTVSGESERSRRTTERPVEVAPTPNRIHTETDLSERSKSIGRHEERQIARSDRNHYFLRNEFVRQGILIRKEKGGI